MNSEKIDRNISYMPQIEFNDISFNVLDINFCIDFGGRQAQITTQRQDNGKEATFVYYWIEDKANYWNVDEVIDHSILPIQTTEDVEEEEFNQNQPIFKMIRMLFDTHADQTREQVKKEVGFK